MKSFNTNQKVTIAIFVILGTILIANQLINNFDFTL
jgi:hypothetical protein